VRESPGTSARRWKFRVSLAAIVPSIKFQPVVAWDHSPWAIAWRTRTTGCIIERWIPTNICTKSSRLLALFQPLIEKDNKRLRDNAPRYYTQIEAFATDERLKAKLTGVFIDWLLQRFRTLGKTEIEKMLLGKLPDLRETQAGKDLIAIGVEQGIEQGELIGTIRTCQSLLDGLGDSEERLLTQSIEELTSMATELQAKLRKRLGSDLQ